MYVYLSCIFVGLLIISNVVSVKLFSFGEIAVLPVAVLAYVFTFPITDVISEVYGRKAAQRTVRAGFITQALVIIFVYISIQIPAASFFEFQEEFALILGAGIRIVAASLLAYLCSQTLDVLIFHKLKERHGGRKLWVRNNLSTMASQLVDTLIFITIAFAGTVPTAILLSMFITQYLFKLILAFADTPLVYLLVNWCRRKEQESEA